MLLPSFFFFPEVEIEGMGMTRNCSFFWTLFCTAMFFRTMGNTERIGEWSSLTAVRAQVFHFIEACTLVPGISLQDPNVPIELQSMCIAPSAFFSSLEMKGRSPIAETQSLQIHLSVMKDSCVMSQY